MALSQIVTSLVEPAVPAGIVPGGRCRNRHSGVCGVTTFCSAMSFENAAGAALDRFRDAIGARLAETQTRSARSA